MTSRWAPTDVLALGVAVGAVALGIGLVTGPATPATTRATATASSSPQTPATASPPPTPPAAPRGISDLPDPSWVAQVASASGIPGRALAAYAGATLAVREEFGACGLGWNTLAAIGQVETHHGSWAGSSIGADGVVSPTIIGIPLDGNGTLVVRDTDDGALDGDRVWDRAVGPMQFIPSTWAAVGSDGNGDLVADVNHIDDAVLSAARHLCTTGGDLSRDENWIRAVAAYNPSVDYNHRVAAAADHYATFG